MMEWRVRYAYAKASAVNLYPVNPMEVILSVKAALADDTEKDCRV